MAQQEPGFPHRWQKSASVYLTCFTLPHVSSQKSLSLPSFPLTPTMAAIMGLTFLKEKSHRAQEEIASTPGLPLESHQAKARHTGE